MNEKYINYIKEKLKDNLDVKYRIIECEEGLIYIIFVDNLCNSMFISENIINPLMNAQKFIDMEKVKKEILYANTIGDVACKDEALLHILSGDVVLIFDFLQSIIFCEAKGFVKRTVTMPLTESVIRGPREGFTEVIVDNISLIRRKVKNENLKFESLYLGKKSNTAVAICYIKGTAAPKLVDYIKNKVKNINEEFILDTSYIEEELKEEKSVFDTIGYTEKPDIAASKLFEGKIVVLVDGTSNVIIAPYFFIENFQAPDDYYLNKYSTNIIRIYRWVAFLFSILLPGLYIALTTYHFSLIPTIFAFRLANARAGVPFPTVVEVVLMSIFFQLLREAGVRLPQPTGQAMSIVGALILGESAVGAGLASQSTIVVVAISAICTFLIPSLYKSVIVWNTVIVVFSSLIGLPGFYLGFFMLISHIAGLKTCGYPYLYPLGTLKNIKSKDILIRNNLNEISNTIFDKDEV